MFIRRNFLSENLHISNEFTTFAVQLGNKTNGLTNRIGGFNYEKFGSMQDVRERCK